MNSTIFITGATSGIGKAIASKFAENKYNLIITGRRKELLHTIAEQLSGAHQVKVLPLCFDVRKKNEVETAIQSLPEAWKHIDILVNNAGLAVGLKPLQEGDFEDWERMIDTNVKGLLYVSRMVLPMMVKNKSGHVINIGSIAGKETYQNGNVYCATKYAVDSLTKAMRIDLLTHNIKVTQICPGAVETEFSLVRFKGDADTAKNVYKGYKPLTGEDIADSVYYVSHLPAHVNINELIIMPTAQANTAYMHKIL